MFSRAASSMWRSRTKSAGGVLGSGGTHNLGAEIPAEFRRGMEIDLPSVKEWGEFSFQRSHAEISDALSGIELDEHVDITCWREAWGEH